MQGKEIEKLTKIIAKLPALGSRSARRIVLQLLKKKETTMLPLIAALQEVADNVKKCPVCGNFDTAEPCSVCQDSARDRETVCVVQDSPTYGLWSASGFIAGNIMF